MAWELEESGSQPVEHKKYYIHLCPTVSKDRLPDFNLYDEALVQISMQADYESTFPTFHYKGTLGEAREGVSAHWLDGYGDQRTFLFVLRYLLYESYRCGMFGQTCSSLMSQMI